MTTPTHQTIAKEAAEKLHGCPWPKSQLESFFLTAISDAEAPLREENERLKVSVDTLTKHHSSTQDSRNDYAKNACEWQIKAVEAQSESTQLREQVKVLLDGMEIALGVIANVSGGNWTLQNAEWIEAAANWRENHWHKALAQLPAEPLTREEGDEPCTNQQPAAPASAGTRIVSTQSNVGNSAANVQPEGRAESLSGCKCHDPEALLCPMHRTRQQGLAQRTEILRAVDTESPAKDTSETPEADSQSRWRWNHPLLPSFTAVNIDFARALERQRNIAQSDLAAARERIAELENAARHDTERIAWLSQQREVEIQQKEAALLESEECLKSRDTALAAKRRAEAERDSLRAQLATAQAELSDIKTILANPQAVYLNLMHGKIATPTAEQLRDVAGGGDYVTVQPLLAELESLRKDKERLDWLNTENCEGWLITTKPKHYRAINYTDIRLAVDAAIDAARTEAKP